MKRKKTKQEKQAKQERRLAELNQRRGAVALPSFGGSVLLAAAVCLPGQAPVIQWGSLLADQPK